MEELPKTSAGQEEKVAVYYSPAEDIKFANKKKNIYI